MSGIAVAKLIFSLLLVPLQPGGGGWGGSLRQINSPKTGAGGERGRRGEQRNVNAVMWSSHSPAAEEHHHSLSLSADCVEQQEAAALSVNRGEK